MELYLELGELYSAHIEIQFYNDGAATETWFSGHTGHISEAQKPQVASGYCPGQQIHTPLPHPQSPTDNMGQKGHVRGTEK